MGSEGQADLPQAPEGAYSAKHVKNGKSARPGRMRQPPILCPECGSRRVWRDGVRRTSHGPVQRWLCRSCGFRFSESTAQFKVKVNVAGKPLKVPHSPMDLTDQRVPSANLSVKEEPNTFSLSSRKDVTSHDSSKNTTVEKGLYPFPLSTTGCRVSATEGEAKNLVKVRSRIEKRAAGATAHSKTDTKTIKGLIVQYAYFLETNGYYKDSAYLQRIKHLAKLGANLLDPEDVKKVIARQTCKDATKLIDVCAYDLIVKHILKTEWLKPRYRQEEHLPFIPEETELDQLVSATKSKRMATFLQTLKETFADPGEALRIEWKDLTGDVVTINHPVKGHRSGKYKISAKLVGMLNNLPKTHNRIFPTTYRSMVHSYNRMRKRLAQRIQNPRIRNVSLTSFRHWGGTMIAHRTNGNVLKVQKALRHKNIKNTMKYINLIGFKDSDYDVEIAETLEEAKQLLKLGYDYVTEMKGARIFRKPKMYGVGG